MDTQRAEISHQFEQLLEEERKIRFELFTTRFLNNFRAAKDTEVINAVQSVKTMLLETINTKIESTQVNYLIA